MTKVDTRGADADPPFAKAHLDVMRGRLAFDIGGNLGHVAAQLAERCDQVVSFEPGVEAFAVLADAADRIDNLTAVNAAVTAIDGRAVLNVQERSILTGQLTSGSGDSHDWGAITDVRVVPGRALDSLAAEYGVPDLVKIDVEGHEAHVVLGGLRILTEYIPGLYIEIHNADLGWRVERMLRPAYDDRLQTIRHPGYPAGSWGHANHYYLIADGG